MVNYEVTKFEGFDISFKDLTDEELLAIKDEANCIGYEFIDNSNGTCTVVGYGSWQGTSFIDSVKERLEYWKTNKE